MSCSFKIRGNQEVHLVEPEVVRLQKGLEFGEELVVVEAIDGLHITSAVIQIAGDLQGKQ